MRRVLPASLGTRGPQGVVLRHSHLQNSSSKAANSSSLQRIMEVLQAERPRSGRSFDSAARSRAAFSSRSSRSIWLSSIPSSSSCPKLHPKLNSPFLSDAFCDQFHPWRREDQQRRHNHRLTSSRMAPKLPDTADTTIPSLLK